SICLFMTSAHNFCSEKAKTDFYIQPPQDEYWNTMHHPVVIEAIDADPTNQWSSLEVIAPEYFKKAWPTVCKLYFVKCDNDDIPRGRPLVHREYYNAMKQKYPTRRVPYPDYEENLKERN